jgi:hypothetical protein
MSNLLHVTVLTPRIFYVTSRISENFYSSDIGLHVNCPLQFSINIFMKFNSVVLELLQAYRRTNDKRSIGTCAYKNCRHRYVEKCDRFVGRCDGKPLIRWGWK